MKTFMGDDYLLNGDLAKELYEKHAANMPIFDYHCHLDPAAIAEDRTLGTITEAWLGKNGKGDHYKWRLLREMGVSEDYITGSRSDWEKFEKFAECFPYFVGNPVYEWCALELKEYFGITKPLCPETAKEIYDEANTKLKQLSVRKILEMSHVAYLFTTDDPTDNLAYHVKMAGDKTLKTKVYPCFRPDPAIAITLDGFLPWVKKLEAASSLSISDLQDFLDAFDRRLAYFVSLGARAADHGISELCFDPNTNYEKANAVFQKRLEGKTLSHEEVALYQSYLLLHLGEQYTKYDMVQQFHFGPIRNVNQAGYRKYGPDYGYDAIGDWPIASSLEALLSALQDKNALPKTVLYTLNDKDYLALVSAMNSFQEGPEAGKLQLGAAWWFNDHYDGIWKQMTYLSADGLLSCFIGMLTDSRSFLSFSRHDFFRRELCSFLASLVEQGRYPNDEKTLGKIVENVSYQNAFRYFKPKA